jgi:hypothetical protein
VTPAHFRYICHTSRAATVKKAPPTIRLTSTSDIFVTGLRELQEDPKTLEGQLRKTAARFPSSGGFLLAALRQRADMLQCRRGNERSAVPKRAAQVDQAVAGASGGRSAAGQWLAA